MTLAEIKKDTAYWQRLLRLGGYNPGAIDGIEGEKTRAAAHQWAVEARQAMLDYGEFDYITEGNLETLLPAAQRRVRFFMLLAQEQACRDGITVKITGGTRSYKEQDKLYNQKPRVTKAKGGYSWHNFGLAADFGLFIGKTYLTDTDSYKKIGKFAREIPKLEWGGDWKSFVDYPHIQLNMFASIAEARAKF